MPVSTKSPAARAHSRSWSAPAFTGWPKKETSLPTDTITRKEIDLRGARTSAGEFPEALELIATKKVDMLKLLTKTVKLEEVPETIIDIEKNPGNYMKVVVTME